MDYIKAKIYTRGPVTAGIAVMHLHKYMGGVIPNDVLLHYLDITHEVLIVGWDEMVDTQDIVEGRN